MTQKQYDARMVAWDTAITVLMDFECDPGDDNADEEMKQAKKLASILEKQCRRFVMNTKIKDPPRGGVGSGRG